MGLLLIIPGIVLEIPDKPWFSGQYGIGTALIWIGAVFLAIQILLTLFIFNKFRDG